ncbi:MAG: CvpA family protein [Bacteroidota bacterium]|nr:CvpA family protein [Bacteroidota bacterium]MDP4216985.1 CvpA family protein [Bacteroidota bacterium]MDP4245197.1 CvpA family protein [Bacteroidota bacterium]MDP4253230.1 CvpA family protein [Bacteroidota bacterium]MDP4258268.1 CvpA family protein [Bacteroidota bacterium]
MWIDVLFLLLLVMAIFKGLRRGLIIAVFSAVAYVVGLAAAIKLSAFVAARLGKGLHLSTRWWPLIAFLLVFVAVVLVVRWAGKLAEAALDMAMMGWLNRLGGVLLYAALYTLLLSVLLFYAVQLRMVPAPTLAASVTYPFIKPWGPVVIDEFGKFIPFFKGMFAQLEDFFGHLSQTRSAT